MLPDDEELVEPDDVVEDEESFEPDEVDFFVSEDPESFDPEDESELLDELDAGSLELVVDRLSLR